MELRDFPMDKQSCFLVLGSCKGSINNKEERKFSKSLVSVTDGYTKDELMYVWDPGQGVQVVTGVELSQFDLISSPYRNLSITRKQGMSIQHQVPSSRS